MNESEEKKKSKVVWIFGIITVVLFLGISLAAVIRTLYGTKSYVVLSKDLELYLDETNNLEDVIKGSVTIPVLDEEGKKTTGYQFSVINRGTEAVKYTIYLVENEPSTMPTYGLRYNLTGPSSLDITGNIKDLRTKNNARKVYGTSIAANSTQSYELKIWLGEKAENDVIGKIYSVKVQIEAEQDIPSYTEDILHGTDPVLSDNLIPVTIANDGTVTYADISNEWYNYEKKQWANAVVLDDSASHYRIGDTIQETDIESYFVWIPRYKYKIFNEGNYTDSSSELNADAPQPIEIEFESKEIIPSNGAAKDEWLSHLAFQVFDTNGFWVGKFESGYRGATTTAEAQVGIADFTKLVIKPNTYSWRAISVGNMFKTSYEYLRDDESHMMKNTEWGAVAYLSHSQYGVNTEVYINNNNTYLTGCVGDTADASSNSSCLNAYGSKMNGVYNQSTTGNISGIFDMSGGAYEYVMGYNTNASSIGGSSGITGLYLDFFTNNFWNKYYDEYTSSSQTTYNNRILGDATGEMGPFNNNHSSWYNDYAWFVHSTDPWFVRGGGYGSTSGAGMFNFYGDNGDSHLDHSFRVVLAL